jgi:hypothetical protein
VKSGPHIDLPLRQREPRSAASDLAGGARRARDTDEARASRGGLLTGGMLIIGLLVGFGGGFVVGQRMAPSSPVSAADTLRLVAPGPAASSTEAGSLGFPANASDATQDRSPAPPGRPASAVAAPPSVPVGPPRPRPATSPRPQAASRPPSTPPSGAPAIDVGTLQVVSRPGGATVYVNDLHVGVTPLTMRDMKVGAYRIRLELIGHRPWATSVTVASGAETRVGASLE